MLTLTCNLKTICEPITFFQGGQHDQLRRNNICFRLPCHFVFILALYLVFGFFQCFHMHILNLYLITVSSFRVTVRIEPILK